MNPVIYPKDIRFRWYRQVEQAHRPVKEVAAIFGISRKTYYKWYAEDHGQASPTYQSSKRQPNLKLTPEVCQLITREKRFTNYASGAIGTAANPINLNLGANATITARAEHDIHIYERSGNMNVETMFSESGTIFLTAEGSIVDGLDTDFTKISANHVELTAVNGGIGEAGDYLDLDVIGAGTLIANAHGNIYIAENFGNMNVEHVQSTNGDVDLQAQSSILDANNNVAPDILANSIKLHALAGGIGVSGNDIDIDTHGGTLTANSGVANIYITETNGDLRLNQVGTGSDNFAFINALTGSILNGAGLGVSNVTSGSTRLFASNDIGASSNALTTTVGNLQGKSTSGSTWITNNGALNVATVDDGDNDTGNAGANGATAGGSVNISAGSPVTVKDNIVAASGNIVIVALDDNLDSDINGLDLLDNDPDNIYVGNGITLTALNGSVRLLAGDDIHFDAGAVINASDSVEFQVDFQGDKFGNPPAAGHVNADAAGGHLYANGTVNAPEIVLRGSDQADDILIDVQGANALNGHVSVKGGDGNDLVTVNKLRTRPGTLDIDGEGGSDHIVVNITGPDENYLINVFDTGKSGVDTLTVNGTAQADTFLLRASASSSGVAFVAAVHGDPAQTAERINYNRNLEHLEVEAGDGDDKVALDDNWAITTIDGGAGADQFQVGQIFKSERDAGAGVAADDVFQTSHTTRGYLSNGVSYQTTINGDDGADNFVVFRNAATLNLNGGAGDDTFTIRAFALEGSQDSTVAGGFGTPSAPFKSGNTSARINWNCPRCTKA